MYFNIFYLKILNLSFLVVHAKNKWFELNTVTPNRRIATTNNAVLQLAVQAFNVNQIGTSLMRISRSAFSQRWNHPIQAVNGINFFVKLRLYVFILGNRRIGPENNIPGIAAPLRQRRQVRRASQPIRGLAEDYNKLIE